MNLSFFKEVRFLDRMIVSKKKWGFSRIGLWYLDIREKLYEARKTIKSHEKFFKYFANSIQDPLCVFNEKGKIRLWNKAFVDIFGKIEKNQFYWEILRERQFKEYVQKSLEGKTLGNHKFITHEKTFMCAGMFESSRKELVLLLRDMTNVSKVKQMKKDLVSNVSHELKTPLTVIGGFAMTLKDLEKDKKKIHYLDVIYRNYKRLDDIVGQLISLSELENDKTYLKNDVDIKNILNFVFSMFEKILEKKQLAAYLHLEDAPLIIKGESFRLEQVFINLIDNAIKYTEKGWVKISAYKDKGIVFVRIEDSGKGIPEKDISHVFDRFYTVDKSRSRAVGGTGLGLSIVRNVIQKHNASIDLKSSLGKGTTITLQFPEKS